MQACLKMVFYDISFIDSGCFLCAGSTICDILEECIFLLCCLPFSSRITVSGTEVYDLYIQAVCINWPSHGRGISVQCVLNFLDRFSLGLLS